MRETRSICNLFFDIKTITCHRVVLLSCIKHRGMEIFHINCIRFYLCFQAESISFIVYMTILAILILHKISSIELYTWTIRSNIHSNSALITVCCGNQSSVSLCIIVCYIVMIISTGKFKLFKISFNILSNLLGSSEIHSV